MRVGANSLAGVIPNKKGSDMKKSFSSFKKSPNKGLYPFFQKPNKNEVF